MDIDENGSTGMNGLRA